MDLKIETTPAYSLVHFSSGRLDAANAPEFRKQMQELINQGNNVLILDLASLKFIDSSGLGAIVATLKMLKEEGELLLCGANHTVLQLFKLTRMDRVFKLYPDVRGALEALK